MLLIVLTGAVGSNVVAQAPLPQDGILKQVDPFIGTGFHGHTFPGPATPFGMVQLSPDTRTSGWDACDGYCDTDTEIWGFSHTHLSGTGTGTPEKPDCAFRSPYKKANQAASPGYYRVQLDRYQIKAELRFATAKDEQVTVIVGISPVDFAAAKGNLMAEIPDWDFDGVVAKAQRQWAKQLDHIHISGGTEAQRRINYTALDHSAISPNIASDVDGRYRGMDQKIHQDPAYTNHTVFSLWDTFRSLLRKYDEGGIQPMWDLTSNYAGCMIGYRTYFDKETGFMRG